MAIDCRVYEEVHRRLEAEQQSQAQLYKDSNRRVDVETNRRTSELQKGSEERALEIYLLEAQVQK